MTDLKEKVQGITLTKVCKVKADADSTDVKTVTVKMNYDGLTLGDVFDKAMRTDIISWQNHARKNFDKYVDKSTVKVNASAPASAPTIDPMDAIIASAKAEGISPEEYVKKQLAERS